MANNIGMCTEDETGLLELETMSTIERAAWYTRAPSFTLILTDAVSSTGGVVLDSACNLYGVWCKNRPNAREQKR